MQHHAMPCQSTHQSNTKCVLELAHVGQHEGLALSVNASVPDGTTVSWELSYGNLYAKDDKSFVPWEMCDWCKTMMDADGRCACEPDSERWTDSSEW